MAEKAGRTQRGCLRLLLLAGGILLLAVLAAALILPRIIPWDRVKQQAEEKVSGIIHHRLTIGSVGFNLLRGVEIHDLAIANAPGFSDQPLLTSKLAGVRYRLLPLLWGKVMVKSVEIQQPQVLVEKQADGTFNFSDMLPAKAAPEESGTAPGRPAMPLELMVSKLAIAGADVMYRDLGTGQTYAVEDFNFEVNHLTLAGLTPVDVTLSAKLKALGMTLPLSAAAKWRLNLKEERLLLEQMEATLPGLSFSAAGQVAGLFAAPRADLAGKVDLDFERLWEGLGPAAAGKLPADVKLGGSAHLEYTVRGPLQEPARLEVYVTDQAALQAQVKELAVPVTLEGDMNLAEGGLSLKQKTVVPGGQAQVQVQVQDLMNSRAVKAAFSADLDLGAASQKLVPPEQAQKLSAYQMQGSLSVNGEVHGSARAPRQLDFSLQASARDVGLQYHDQSLLSGLRGQLTLTPDKAVCSGVKLKLGGQTVDFFLTATDFDLRDPASLKPERLRARVKWQLTSPLLDVDALLSLLPRKTPAEAETAPAATVSDLPEPDVRKWLPAGLRLQGEAALGGLKFAQVKLGKMNFQVKLEQKVLNETGTIHGYGGSIEESVRLDFSQVLLGYRIKVVTKQVEAEPLLNDIVDTFVAAKLKKPELVAELKDKLVGKLGGTLELRGSGLRTVNAKPRLAGNGSFILQEGRLRQFAFQDQLAKWFGSEKFKQDIPFDHTAADFTVADQEVRVTRFVAESGPKGKGGDIRLTAEGRLTFTAQFKDFKMRPRLNPRASASLSSEFGRYSEILKDDNGWVAIPVILNGPLRKPDVQPDWVWIKERLGAYASEKAKAAAREAGQKAQKYIEQQKGKSAEEIKQNVNQEINRAKEQLKGLDLKKLFK